MKKILCILDDKNSDIYIHIDKKAGDYDESELCGCVKEANLYFTERLDVQWGAYSQIACEMLLLREAVDRDREYSHYHLISGVDMPLKTPKEMQEFMLRRQGASFIALDPSAVGHPETFMDRIKYYYPLGQVIGKPKGIVKLGLHYLQSCFLWMQKVAHIDRTRKAGNIFYKGANWFSITHEMALYVLGKEEYIRKRFSYSFCADEIFLQTVAYRSPLKETIENDSLRCIDWERGMPYVFRVEDFDMIVNSGKLFARKFSTSVDEEIIDRIYDSLMEKKRLGE